jgi:hypothetical protein
MTAHDWQPLYASEKRDADQCKNCGVIRINVRWHKEPFTRFSRPNANINHCNVWRKEEPPCTAPSEPITVTIRRTT